MVVCDELTALLLGELGTALAAPRRSLESRDVDESAPGRASLETAACCRYWENRFVGRNCQLVTIVKPKKCALGVCEKRTSEGVVAAREDSEKLSGWFLIRRQTGSEGVAGGRAKCFPTGQPRVTQPWLNRILILRPVECHRAGRFMPIVKRRPRTKKAPDGETRVASLVRPRREQWYP